MILNIIRLQGFSRTMKHHSRLRIPTCGRHCKCFQGVELGTPLKQAGCQGTGTTQPHCFAIKWLKLFLTRLRTTAKSSACYCKICRSPPFCLWMKDLNAVKIIHSIRTTNYIQQSTHNTCSNSATRLFHWSNYCPCVSIRIIGFNTLQAMFVTTTYYKQPSVENCNPHHRAWSFHGCHLLPYVWLTVVTFHRGKIWNTIITTWKEMSVSTQPEVYLSFICLTSIFCLWKCDH